MTSQYEDVGDFEAGLELSIGRSSVKDFIKRQLETVEALRQYCSDSLLKDLKYWLRYDYSDESIPRIPDQKKNDLKVENFVEEKVQTI